MFKFKSTLIALAITFLMLAGFVNSSDAIEIIELGPENNSYEAYDAGDGAYHRVYVETDMVFYEVNWYVDGKHSGWSDGSNVRDHTWFTLSNLTGNHNGTSYEIKAEVWSLDENGNTAFDTDSYTLTVYTFQMVEMYPSKGGYEDFSNSLWHTAYIKTSRPYDYLYWFINGTIVGYDISGNGQSEAYFTTIPEDYPGSISGISYTVSAYASKGGAWVSDSYQVTVYKPMIDTQTDREKKGRAKIYPEVSGYTELSRHYRVGNDVIMDYYLLANYFGNDENIEYTVYGECKNTIIGLTDSKPGDSGKKKIHTQDRLMVVSDSVSQSLAGGNSDTEYQCEAYIRLVVSDGTNPDEHIHFTHDELWFKPIFQ